MSKKIKILYFLNTNVRGGTEEHVLNLSAHLDRNAFVPLVVLPPELALIMEDDFNKINVRFEKIYVRSWLDVREIIKFIKLLNREKPDIVNPHLFFASRFASPIAKFCGVPVVIETAHIREAWRKGFIKTFYPVDRFFSLFVNRFIAVSHAVKEYLINTKGIKPGKIRVIHNGIDTAKFAEAGKKDNLVEKEFSFKGVKIGVIGRLEPQKGHIYFLEAAKIVLNKIKDVKFFVIGEGRLRKELELKAVNFGIGKNILFTGYHKNLPAALSMLDIFVLPSLYEGLPVVVMEALVALKPVVVTAVDGSPEIVKNHETGIVVPPENPSSLAEAIIFLIKNREIAKKYAEKGKENILKNFTIERQVRDTERFYRECMQRR